VCYYIFALISYYGSLHKSALPLVTKRLTVQTTHRGTVGTRGVLRAVEGSLRTAGRLVVRRAVGPVRKLAAAAKRVWGQPREEVVQPGGGGAGNESAAGVHRGSGDLREKGRLNHCHEAAETEFCRSTISPIYPNYIQSYTFTCLLRRLPPLAHTTKKGNGAAAPSFKSQIYRHKPP
jgi:hypothetical protein